MHEVLHDLVEAYSLVEVLEGLADICEQKAVAAWELDEDEARTWRQDGHRIRRVAACVTN